MNLINIGFGNTVNSDRVVAVLGPEAAPVKRLVSKAKDDGNCIDATAGRKTKAVIITDCGLIILSYLQPETVELRFNDGRNGNEQ